jgi:hypothetical protein
MNKKKLKHLRIYYILLTNINNIFIYLIVLRDPT